MATSDEVAAKLPGLQFSVTGTRRFAAPASGMHSGEITLRCEVTDVGLFDAAVAKLDGYKMFSSCTEEIITALGMELDSLTTTLQQAHLLERALRREIAGKDKELKEMQRFLADLEQELGIKMPER